LHSCLLTLTLLFAGRDGQDQSSTAQSLSKVTFNFLQTEILAKYFVDFQLRSAPASSLAASHDYQPFEWQQILTETKHKCDDVNQHFTNGGYVKHVQLIFPEFKVLPDIRFKSRPAGVCGLNGTIDLGITYQEIDPDKNPVANFTYVAIELKKDISATDVHQALATLIALDNLTAHYVLTVLTDLHNDWRLFWFARNDNGASAYQYMCGPAVAIEMIREFVDVCCIKRQDPSQLATFPIEMRSFFKLHRLSKAPSASFSGSLQPQPPSRDEGSDGDDNLTRGRGGSRGTRGGKRGTRGSKGGARGGQKARGGARTTHLRDTVVVDGMVLTKDQHEQFKQYIIREAMACSPLFQLCGFVNTPPPFMLEQDI
jgi:hypothetical protein